MEPRSWIADRLSRYFRAVDDKDLGGTLLILEGVALSQRDRVLDDPETRSQFYTQAFASPGRTAHVLGNLVVDRGGDIVEYWASYLRYEVLEAAPRLQRIGACGGRFSTAGEGTWLAHGTR